MPLQPPLPRHRARRTGRALAALIAAGAAAWTAAAAPDRPPPLPPAPIVAGAAGDDPLTRARLTLSDERPYRYTLAYRGPLLPFRGHVCYGFAGYNETCVDPGISWLTPATDIQLDAPGGVPRDLLEGYVMEVRYPALSPRTYRYALGSGRTARPAEPRVP